MAVAVLVGVAELVRVEVAEGVNVRVKVDVAVEVGVKVKVDVEVGVVVGVKVEVPVTGGVTDGKGVAVQTRSQKEGRLLGIIRQAVRGRRTTRQKRMLR